MKTLILTAFAGAALVGGTTLTTKYTTDQGIQYEIESTMTMATTSMEMERDGEPVEAPGGGGRKSETTQTEIVIDRVVEIEEGKPTKVRRTFERVGGTSVTTMGEEDRSTDLESPFEGVTLEIVAGKDGELEFEAIEGTKPDHDKAMDGQRLTSFLDGLLPKDAVEVDATWDLEKDAIVHALRLDVRRPMFPPPERAEGAGGPGGGGGGGGRRGGGMGGSASSILEAADWKGTAKLISTEKDVDGVMCAVVELKLEAAGEREMPAFGGGRRERMFGAAESAFENKMTYEARVAGKFYFATKEKRPVKLDLEGTIHTDSRMEMTRQETSIKTHSVQDGKIEFKVDVSQAPAAEKKAEKKAEKSDK